MNNPSVAILMATYNGSEYLSEMLASLCLQKYTDFCIYVHDDGSADNTLQVLQSYNKNLDIRMVPAHPHQGAASSFFYLMQCVDEHQYYLLCDQDDVWLPEKVLFAVNEISKCGNNLVLYCGRQEYVDANLAHLAFSSIPKRLDFSNALVQSVALGCTIAFNDNFREKFVRVRPYDFIMHDWWLYLFATAFGQVIYDSRPMIKYRQHSKNTIGVCSSPIKAFFKRLDRLFKGVGGINGVSKQSQAFYQCYGEALEPSKRKLLHQLAYSSSRLQRIGLALNLPVYRQSYFETFMLRLILLLGRY